MIQSLQALFYEGSLIGMQVRVDLEGRGVDFDKVHIDDGLQSSDTLTVREDGGPDASGMRILTIENQDGHRAHSHACRFLLA